MATMAKDSGSNDEPPDPKDDSEPTPESSVRFDASLQRPQEAQGETLEEMLERSGLTPSYVGMIEIGDSSQAAFTALATGPGAPDGVTLEGEPTLCAMAGEAAKLPSPEVREAIITILRVIAKWRSTQAAQRK